MALPPQKFREIVFQLLYSHDMSKTNDDDMLRLMMAELAVTKQIVTAAQTRMRAVIAHQSEIDDLIAAASLSYAFERIPSVERNILRLGVFEMVFDKEVPPKAALAEAIRLARKFSTPESASFVNAILDNIYKSNHGIPVDQACLSKALESLSESEEIAEKAGQAQPPSIGIDDAEAEPPAK